jgi:uncharacterized protein YndB with AHSA1/START domain
MTALAAIRQTVVVPLEAARAFDLFVFHMADWWPLATRSVLLTNAVSCHVEPRVSGRVFERGRDGREVPWGRILVWDAPNRVAFTWHPGMPEEDATEIDIRFTALGTSTRVELEHRNWERMGERAAFVRGLYEHGWPGILGRFTERANGSANLSPVGGRGCAG